MDARMHILSVNYAISVNRANRNPNLNKVKKKIYASLTLS